MVIILGFDAYSVFYNPREQSGLIDETTFQAVFLNNNQIYFGKLKNINSQYPLLNNVYYVKLESPEAVSGQLVKLGQEPHGPQDQMVLNRDHILFWENLRPDSTVVQSIRNLMIIQ